GVQQQRLLRPPLLGHVYAGADVASEEPAGFKTWRALIIDPAVLAVGATQAILHAEFATLDERGQVGVHAALKVLRVHALRPTVPHLLLHAPARELQPAIVDELAQPI